MPITRPDQGDPTRLALLFAILDDLEALQAAIGGVAGGGSLLPNSSFETDSDENGIPDGWTWEAFTGGTAAIDDTESSHAGKSFKITSPGGAGNGGGTLTTTEFYECGPRRPIQFSWQMMSSVVDIKNQVMVRWYSTADEADYISSSTLYDEDANNALDWAVVNATAKAPDTARYFKLQLVGAESSDDTAGSVWFDDLVAQVPLFTQKTEFRKAGTYQFIVPTDVFRVRAKAIGPGGGGAGGSGGSPGSGGGGGGYSEKVLAVVPGQVLAIVVGAGGVGGASATAGGAGGTTTIEATEVIANGGSGGIANDSTPPGGAGAVVAGAAGDLMIPGGSGFILAGAYSGQGGHAVGGGGGAPGVLANTAGIAGVLAGEGGSGGNQPTYSGGSGAPGAAIIEW